MAKKELTLRELLIGYEIRKCLKIIKRQRNICMTRITHLDHCWLSINPPTKEGCIHVSIRSGDPNEREPSVYNVTVFEKDIKTPAAWLGYMTDHTRFAKVISDIPEDKESGLEYAGFENPYIVKPVITAKTNTWAKVVGRRLITNSIATYMADIIEKYHLNEVPTKLDTPVWVTPTVKFTGTRQYTGFENYYGLTLPGNCYPRDYMLMHIVMFSTTEFGWPSYEMDYCVRRTSREGLREDLMNLFDIEFSHAVDFEYDKTMCNLIITNVRRVKDVPTAATDVADKKIPDAHVEIALAAEISTRMRKLTGVKMPMWMVQPALDAFDVVQVTGDISKKGTTTINLTPTTKEHAPIF